MRKKFFKNNQGMMLMETILYLAVATTILTGVSVFLAMILGSKTKAVAMTEVESQGVFLTDFIGDRIGMADEIVTPEAGSEENSLSLRLLDGAVVTFELTDGILRFTDGTGQSFELSNSNVILSDLVFKNQSIPGTAGLIDFNFSLEAGSLANKQEFYWKDKFQMSTSLRK